MNGWCRLYVFRFRSSCSRRLLSAVRVLLLNEKSLDHSSSQSQASDFQFEWSMKQYKILASLVIFLVVFSIITILVWTMFSTCVLFPSLYYPFHRVYQAALRMGDSHIIGVKEFDYQNQEEVNQFLSSDAAVAWMDPREHRLMDRTLQSLSDSLHRPLRLLEFGSGASSFYFSGRRYTSEYLSVESSLQFCQQMEALANEKQRAMDIYYINRKPKKQSSQGESEEGEASADSMDESIPHWEKGTYRLFISSYKSIQSSSPSSIPPLSLYCISQNLPRAEERSTWWSLSCCISRCPSSYAQFRDYIDLPKYLPLTKPADDESFDSSMEEEEEEEGMSDDGAEQSEEERRRSKHLRKTRDRLSKLKRSTKIDSDSADKKDSSSSDESSARRLLDDEEEEEEEEKKKKRKARKKKMLRGSEDSEEEGEKEKKEKEKEEREEKEEEEEERKEKRQKNKGGSSKLSPYLHRSPEPLQIDAAFIDGRARPQVAIELIPHLHNSSLVFVHDVNHRSAYRYLLSFFDIVDQQLSSQQAGGGGLWVLRKKNPVKNIQQVGIPYWYLDDRLPIASHHN